MTGGGGIHCFFRWPPTASETRLKKPEMDEFNSIDLKYGDGQYVVSAGSMHGSGNRYEIDPLHDDFTNIPYVPKELHELLTTSTQPSSAKPSGPLPTISNEGLQKLLELLDVEDFSNYDKWLKLLFSCQAITAGDGFEVFLNWCTFDPLYSEREADILDQWNGVNVNYTGRKVTGATLIRLAIDRKGNALVRGILKNNPACDFDGKIIESSLTHNSNEVFFRTDSSFASAIKLSDKCVAVNDYENAIASIQMLRISPAWNELSEHVELRGKSPFIVKHGRLVTDMVIKMIRLELASKNSENAYQPSLENVREAIDTIAFEHPFNPVLEYINHLAWDGVERLKFLFPKYFGTEDDAFSEQVSLCFGVAAVRRMRQLGCKFDTMVVLTGAQGIGKPTGFRALFGDDYFSDAELGRLDGKDAFLLLQGKWCLEIAELKAVRFADNETLKAFISRQSDRYRPPYGKIASDHPRRLVFAATGNETRFLKDTTGNRRF